MKLPANFQIERAMPVTRALLAQALSTQCVCGNDKVNLDLKHPRPFCYPCVQELLTRNLRTVYSLAYQETRVLADLPENGLGFMWAYDLCCDAIAAIRRGQWPTHLRRKNLEQERA